MKIKEILNLKGITKWDRGWEGVNTIKKMKLLKNMIYSKMLTGNREKFKY